MFSDSFLRCGTFQSRVLGTVVVLSGMCCSDRGSCVSSFFCHCRQRTPVVGLPHASLGNVAYHSSALDHRHHSTAYACEDDQDEYVEAFATGTVLPKPQ